jgi:restriction system protein
MVRCRGLITAPKTFPTASVYGVTIKGYVMQTACGECGLVLDEDFNLAAEERSPCPNCGSKTRAYSVNIAATATAMASAVATVKVRSLSELPQLLLQAVIKPGAKNVEGFDIVALLEKNPHLAFEIPPGRWEEIIAGAYQASGFDEVILTPRSGDYGRDVIATKRGIGSVRVIDQVKAYKPGHNVTANDVRALVGVLHGDGASKGFLTTTSDFAPLLRGDPLIQPFVPSRLELVNGDALLARLAELGKKKQ